MFRTQVKVKQLKTTQTMASCFLYHAKYIAMG